MTLTEYIVWSIRLLQNNLYAMTGTYVDDSDSTGNKRLEKSKLTEHVFDFKIVYYASLLTWMQIQIFGSKYFK